MYMRVDYNAFIILYIQFLSIPVNCEAFSWQFCVEFGALYLCYHEVHSLIIIIINNVNARFPSSV